VAQGTYHELYQQIVAQEHKIETLGTVRFADLMTELKEWRRLMLQAEFATAEDVKGLCGGDIREKDGSNG